MQELEGKTWMAPDLVSMHEGYFHFFDRKRDLDQAPGYSVIASTCEEVLSTIPRSRRRVVEAAPKFGQLIKAYVVLQPRPGQAFDEELTPIANRSCPYKVPQIIEFGASCPRPTCAMFPAGAARKAEDGLDICPAIL